MQIFHFTLSISFPVASLSLLNRCSGEESLVFHHFWSFLRASDILTCAGQAGSARGTSWLGRGRTGYHAECEMERHPAYSAWHSISWSTTKDQSTKQSSTKSDLVIFPYSLLMHLAYWWVAWTQSRHPRIQYKNHLWKRAQSTCTLRRPNEL